jgi:hypothetical protein
MSQNRAFNKLDKGFLLSFPSWKHIHPLVLLDSVFSLKACQAPESPGRPWRAESLAHGHGGRAALVSLTLGHSSDPSATRDYKTLSHSAPWLQVRMHFSHSGKAGLRGQFVSLKIKHFLKSITGHVCGTCSNNLPGVACHREP